MKPHYSPAVNLTPWIKVVIGDTASVRLAHGYRLMGRGRSSSGPWTMTLYRPGAESLAGVSYDVIAERECLLRADVRPAFDSLVDLSWIDARERNCAICGRRPSEMSVALGDRIVGICETCYERGREAMPA